MTDPHAGAPVLSAGTPLASAKAAMILIHGRGASADDIIGLAPAFQRPALTYLAPDAVGHVWYPQRFIAPRMANEPYLSSALNLVGRLVADVEKTVPADKIILLGFSQGACLALEYAAKHPRRYGGIVGLSGGLIGERLEAKDYPGSLAGTPAFLGCSNVDFHIPLARVQESTAILKGMGAAVTERIYPNAGHTVVPDEVVQVRAMIDALG